MIIFSDSRSSALSSGKGKIRSSRISPRKSDLVKDGLWSGSARWGCLSVTAAGAERDVGAFVEGTGLDCPSPMPRIVSLLPAATEIVCALGAGDQLVGRSRECDYPASVQRLPIVSRPALELSGLSQGEIDAAVSKRMQSGESLYLVDEELLRSLEPELILTQDLCQVCAPSGNELSRAITSLPTNSRGLVPHAADAGGDRRNDSRGWPGDWAGARSLG